MADVVILAGSTGKNLDLANTFQTSLSKLGHPAHVIDVCNLDIPLYTPERDKSSGEIPDVIKVMKQIVECNALIVCAPEYNGLIPAALTNLINWLSVQSDDFRMLFNRKTVGLASVSGGGGHQAIMSMRLQFSYLGSNVLGRSAIINKTKPFNQSSIDAMVEQVIQ